LDSAARSIVQRRHIRTLRATATPPEYAQGRHYGATGLMKIAFGVRTTLRGRIAISKKFRDPMCTIYSLGAGSLALTLATIVFAIWMILSGV